MQTYSSFAGLQAIETIDIDYRMRVRRGKSGLAIMAIHGGGIEPGTTEIAEAVAGEDHTFYSFSGLKLSGNSVLHISSRKFDEPLAIDVARKALVVVTVHGCRDRKRVTLLGGRCIQLKKAIKQALTTAGFPVADAMRFSGVNPKNICNKGRLGKGVQVEVSLGMRQQLFVDLRRLHRRPSTPCFDAYVRSLRQGINWLSLPETL